ncbi:hypothetical protein FH972_011390 [Carpinus fangiana]|uniref:Uncharacterized protein n=1 Tax=Carpinus fangiana TaxID=176857 RepID=A0A660KU73_9ROSI|nr:hypothetical protein FH972_011390 [Carpinus fangiana]
MASGSANTHKQNNTTGSPLPKRGQVKAQIFDSLARGVASVVGKALGSFGGAAGSGGNSAASTPPPSAYNSDGHPDTS